VLLQVSTSRDKDVDTLIKELFGDAGLVSCTDDVSYDAELENIQNDVYSQLPTQLKVYVVNKVEPMLRDNMRARAANWTNNACESINHVLKQRLQWRVAQLPDLVDHLRTLVEAQFREADRALCGRGEYMLRPQYARHRVTVDVWRWMSE